MLPVTLAVAIGVFAVLHVAVFWFTPLLTRRDLYFAVTVAPGFRESPDGKGILRRYRIELTVLAALALAAAATGVSRLGIAFAPAGFIMVLAGSFCGFYRARLRVRPHAVAPTMIREVDLSRDDRRVPGGWLLGSGPFVLLAGCTAFLWTHGGEVPARFAHRFAFIGQMNVPPNRIFAGVYFLSIAGILAAFTLFRYGMSHWARSVYAGGHELLRELRFRKASSVVVLLAEYLIAIRPSWPALIPHPRNITGSPNEGILVASFGLFLILTLMAVVALARLGQGGSRLAASTETSRRTSDVPTGDRTDDRHWKLGVVYFNRDDAAVIIEKRFGLGYTLNFARLAAWIIVSFLLIGPLIPVLGSR